MIKLNYAGLATGVSIDSATGNVTLFNIIEEVRIPRDRLPIAIPELAFVGSFTRMDPAVSSMGFKLEYIMPSGKTIMINQSDSVFQGDRMRVVMRLNGMPIEAFGRHKVRVSWNWRGGAAPAGGDDDDREGMFDVFLDAFAFDAPAQGAPPQAN